MSLKDLLANSRLVVCVGSGGVGKTTTSAALAIAAARLGRRAIVITIDPARRLANALGLKEIGNVETPIRAEVFARHGVNMTGSCHAMMLDVRTTFDDLVSRVSPDNATAKRIFQNSVYQHVASAVAGSHEYMATEKVYELYRSETYDLIVLDTPPMKNALDFLEAQNRFLGLLDETVIGWFLKNNEGARSRFALSAGNVVTRLLGYILGEKFVGDVVEFFECFAELIAGFRVRNHAVHELLRAATSHFLVVTSPRPQAVAEAEHFQRDLAARGLPFAGYIVNQVSPFAAAGDIGPLVTAASGAVDAAARHLAAEYPEMPGLTARVQKLIAAAAETCARDQQLIARLSGKLSARQFLRPMPRLPGEVYDVGSLLQLQPYLLGDAQPA